MRQASPRRKVFFIESIIEEQGNQGPNNRQHAEYDQQDEHVLSNLPFSYEP